MSPSTLAGSYRPGASPLHRLDARVKLMALLVLTIALFGVGSVPCLAVLLCASVALLRMGGGSFRELGRALVPVLIMCAFIVAFNAVRADGSFDVPLFGAVGISLAGLVKSVAVTLRIVALVVLSLAVSATASTEELTGALLSLMAPLRRVRVPVDDVATTLTMALRFIPVVGEQYRRVVMAQRARGARVGEGSLWQKLTSFIPVIIPLVVGLFRRSEALGMAMQARCYAGQGRTQLSKPHLRVQDVGALAVVCMVSCVLVIVF